MADDVWADARVCILDDEPSNVLLLERLLGQEGYRHLVTLTDPRRFIALLDEAPPDLVLLDLLMPHVDGYDVLERIGERWQGVRRPPVLVLTADATPAARERALTAGAMDFLTKPFDALDVLLRVRNLLARRRLELELLSHNESLERRVRSRTRELQTSLERLRRASRQREALLERFVSAQEEERARVATDVHDDTVQAMVAAGIRLELLARRLPDPDRRAEVDQVRGSVSDALDRLRALMFDLRPAALESDGLAAALRLHMERRLAGGPTHELISNLEKEPPMGVRTVLFRIAQEALANVRRHSGASHVSVTLSEREGSFGVTIQDDGRGFDPGLVPAPGAGHFGLVSMSERASVAGGSCQVTSSPGQGTLVSAWLPGSHESRLKRSRQDA